MTITHDAFAHCYWTCRNNPPFILVLFSTTIPPPILVRRCLTCVLQHFTRITLTKPFFCANSTSEGLLPYVDNVINPDGITSISAKCKESRDLVQT